MKQLNILFILNPIAGDKDKSQCKHEVLKRAKKENHNLKLYETTGKNDKDKISSLILKFKPHRIWVAGGDGTIQLVASLIIDKDIILSILPYGSANGLAANLELPADLNSQLDIALGDTTLDLDTLTINNHTCLHIADLGINAALIQNYERSQIRGKLGYLLQSLPTLVKEDYPFEFTIKTKDKTFSEKGILLAIANANKFGTGANINPRGKMNDGIFEILIFKRLDMLHILRTLYEEADLESDFVEMISASEATIFCKTKTPFQIDGEYIDKTQEVNVKINHQKIKITIPN